MELTKKQERIISALIKFMIVAAIFFPIRDQYGKRSLYYTTFALPSFLCLCLVAYLGTVNTIRREKSRFMSVFLFFFLLYVGADLYINFAYHHYYWELFHKATAFLLLPFLWYKLPEDFFERKKIISFLLTVIVISCMLSIATYYMGIDQIKFTKASLIPKIIHHGEATYPEKRLTFTYPHKSEYGVFLVLFTGLCLKFRSCFVNKVLFYCTIPLLLYTTYLTDSVAALAAVTLVVLGYVMSRLPWRRLVEKYKILIGGIGIFLCGLSVYVYQYVAAKRDLSNMGARIPIWKASVEAILKTPQGIGMEFEKQILFMWANNCHNVFLVEALRFSIVVGCLFLLLFLLLLGKTFWKYTTFSAAVWISLFGMLSIDYSLKDFNTPMLLFCLFLLFFIEAESVCEGEKDAENS